MKFFDVTLLLFANFTKMFQKAKEIDNKYSCCQSWCEYINLNFQGKYVTHKFKKL